MPRCWEESLLFNKIRTAYRYCNFIDVDRQGWLLYFGCRRIKCLKAAGIPKAEAFAFLILCVFIFRIRCLRYGIPWANANKASFVTSIIFRELSLTRWWLWARESFRFFVFDSENSKNCQYKSTNITLKRRKEEMEEIYEICITEY